jgi:hypothetical protein
MRGHGFRVPLGRVQGLDLPEQPGIVRGDLSVERVEQPQRGRQIEEMFFAPGAGEIPGDLFLRMPTATVTMGGQTGRIAFARHDGAHNRHASHAREVGNGAMHLYVHLIERLLHPLDTARALGHEIGQLALQGAQPGDGLARAERAPKQPAAVEHLEPLTVAEVGLPPRDVMELAGVDEDDLDALRLEELVDGDPVDVRALHGHRLHALVAQPGGELMPLIGRGSRTPARSRCRRLSAGHRPNAEELPTSSPATLGRMTGSDVGDAVVVFLPSFFGGDGHILTSCGDGPDPRWPVVLDSDLGECARGATRVNLINERSPTRTQTSPGARALQCVNGA